MNKRERARMNLANDFRLPVCVRPGDYTFDLMPDTDPGSVLYRDRPRRVDVKLTITTKRITGSNEDRVDALDAVVEKGDLAVDVYAFGFSGGWLAFFEKAVARLERVEEGAKPRTCPTFFAGVLQAAPPPLGDGAALRIYVDGARAVACCHGSACALWDPARGPDDEGFGRCGLGKGSNFYDPRLQVKS